MNILQRIALSKLEDALGKSKAKLKVITDQVMSIHEEGEKHNYTTHAYNARMEKIMSCDFKERNEYLADMKKIKEFKQNLMQ